MNEHTGKECTNETDDDPPKASTPPTPSLIAPS